MSELKKDGIVPAAAIALVAAVAFLAWVFAQPGTLGMYRWGYQAPVLGLSALGVTPLVMALLLKRARS
ncbi:MAG: hypothetical protein JXM71_05030, partial [Spirochaetales bacterium]|nr:hypothetical protein [Spirochaetales bacterium]